jgi:hypothetical protein
MSVCKLLLPHAEAIMVADFDDDESLLQSAIVLGKMAGYMVTAGYGGASACDKAEKALSIRSSLLDMNYTNTLESTVNLVYVLHLLGKFEAAEVLNQQAWEGCEKVLGANNPDMLKSVSNLALVLKDLGKYETAE